MRRVALAQLLGRLGRNVRMFSTKRSHDDLTAICRLIESGELKSVIDRTYPFVQTAAAIVHVETGHARGKVVVTVG
jgi:NADPH:quinone reductase-like Zn-dependent oxidoreductase